jgi:hypothetical protein
MCLLSIAFEALFLEAPLLIALQQRDLEALLRFVSAEDSKNAPARGARGGTTQPKRAE